MVSNQDNVHRVRALEQSSWLAASLLPLRPFCRHVLHAWPCAATAPDMHIFSTLKLRPVLVAVSSGGGEQHVEQLLAMAIPAGAWVHRTA